MTGPRPDAGSEAAGESEYGNDTGFAEQATGAAPPAPPAAEQESPDPDDDGPGRGGD